jgi:hypothetical protein
MTDVPSKKCTKCGATFPATPEFFHRHARGKSCLSVQCKTCAMAYQRNWGEKNRERVQLSQRAYRQRNPNKSADYGRRLRTQVLTHYGGDPPHCACCGEAHYEFLAIDHIEGGGGTHRKQIGGMGARLYRWLIANDYPDGYRVLCHNCNSALGHYGFCPHGSEGVT